jgi:hypothetical protein
MIGIARSIQINVATENNEDRLPEGRKGSN